MAGNLFGETLRLIIVHVRIATAITLKVGEGGSLVITFQLIKGFGCFVVCAGAEAIKLLPTHTFG